MARMNTSLSVSSCLDADSGIAVVSDVGVLLAAPPPLLFFGGTVFSSYGGAGLLALVGVALAAGAAARAATSENGFPLDLGAAAGAAPPAPPAPLAPASSAAPAAPVALAGPPALAGRGAHVELATHADGSMDTVFFPPSNQPLIAVSWVARLLFLASFSPASSCVPMHHGGTD